MKSRAAAHRFVALISRSQMKMHEPKGLRALETQEKKGAGHNRQRNPSDDSSRNGRKGCEVGRRAEFDHASPPVGPEAQGRLPPEGPEKVYDYNCVLAR